MTPRQKSPVSVADLPSLLSQTGPTLTSDLIEHMVAGGATEAAARQRLARGLAGPYGEITRLAGLRFRYNARFVYRTDQFGDRKFWDALERAFASHGPAYGGVVSVLRARGGSAPKSLFAAISGVPIARKGQLSPDRILERLSAIQLLKEEEGEDGVRYVRFGPHHYTLDPAPLIRARLLAEQIALQGMQDWVRKVGFGSYDKVRIRGEGDPPNVANLVWDLSAPSYLRPLVNISESGARPGFVVADINLRGVLAEDAVRTFIRKCDLAAAPKGIAPILPILIAESFAPDAYALARKKGIMATTISLLLGEAIAKALQELITLLSDMGATAAVNPDQVERVFGALSRIEGAAMNLRGPLLELVVAHVVKEMEKGSVIVGRNVVDQATGRSADIDVLLIRPDGAGLLVIECKAKEPGGAISLDAVKKWREDRVPLIHRALRWEPRFTDTRLRFELWTNAPLDPDAAEWLTKNAQHQPDFELGWRDGSSLRTYAAGAKSQAISKMLNEHFYQHPLAKQGSRRAKKATN